MEPLSEANMKLTHVLVQTTLDNTAGFGLEPSATYVIAGGLGEIGRSTARWMIGRNARNLILLSRSGNTNEKARTFIEELEHEGVRVEAPACDITNSKMMHETLGNLVRNMPPVNGCVQATMNARVKPVSFIIFAGTRQLTASIRMSCFKT